LRQSFHLISKMLRFGLESYAVYRLIVSPIFHCDIVDLHHTTISATGSAARSLLECNNRFRNPLSFRTVHHLGGSPAIDKPASPPWHGYAGNLK